VLFVIGRIAVVRPGGTAGDQEAREQDDGDSAPYIHEHPRNQATR